MDTMTYQLGCILSYTKSNVLTKNENLSSIKTCSETINAPLTLRAKGASQLFTARCI